MSWSDPSRRFEPAEDVELRAEMSDLLGFEPTPRAGTEPTPELIALSEELRKEALRRKRRGEYADDAGASLRTA